MTSRTQLSGQLNKRSAKCSIKFILDSKDLTTLSCSSPKHRFCMSSVSLLQSFDQITFWLHYCRSGERGYQIPAKVFTFWESLTVERALISTWFYEALIGSSQRSIGDVLIVKTYRWSRHLRLFADSRIKVRHLLPPCLLSLHLNNYWFLDIV